METNYKTYHSVGLQLIGNRGTNTLVASVNIHLLLSVSTYVSRHDLFLSVQKVIISTLIPVLHFVFGYSSLVSQLIHCLPNQVCQYYRTHLLHDVPSKWSRFGAQSITLNNFGDGLPQHHQFVEIFTCTSFGLR